MKLMTTAAIAALMVCGAVTGAMADHRGWGLDWNRARGDWDLMGSGAFSYRGGSRTVDSVRGRNVLSLGLRPDGGDASCRQILVRFANGERRSLDVDNLDYMQDGKLYRVDLPGNRRDVLRVAYTCRAEQDRVVNILLYIKR
jgi:hypothetical protein